MRKAEKEVGLLSDMEDILRKSPVLRLAMIDGDRPYLVPLCFGYRDMALFFHCAREGRKIDILRKNPAVWFEATAKAEILPGNPACRFSVSFESVMGEGVAEILDNEAERRLGLDCIMAHYGASPPFEYDEKSLALTCVVKVRIESMTGKRSKS